MSARFTTRPGGERVDRLARRIYGTEGNGGVEALLEANPALAKAPAHGAPEGLVVTAPTVTPPPVPVVRVWE